MLSTRSNLPPSRFSNRARLHTRSCWRAQLCSFQTATRPRQRRFQCRPPFSTILPGAGQKLPPLRQATRIAAQQAIHIHFFITESRQQRQIHIFGEPVGAPPLQRQTANHTISPAFGIKPLLQLDCRANQICHRRARRKIACCSINPEVGPGGQSRIALRKLLSNAAIEVVVDGSRISFRRSSSKIGVNSRQFWTHASNRSRSVLVFLSDCMALILPVTLAHHEIYRSQDAYHVAHHVARQYGGQNAQVDE